MLVSPSVPQHDPLGLVLNCSLTDVFLQLSDCELESKVK